MIGELLDFFGKYYRLLPLRGAIEYLCNYRAGI